MALEVLHNLAATHENEQFRRVVELMHPVFEKHGFNGILIGNPFNENYRRFRADAILLYDKGAVVIDFKDYSGILTIPKGDDDFKYYPWVAENSSDHQAIEVKGGAHFINPFAQLASYRSAFREIVERNPVLKDAINPSRICIANIFSGPLTLSSKVPGKYPYYKIVQESEIGKFLYDLNNDNCYSEEVANTLKALFPADEYVREYEPIVEVIQKRDIVVGESAKAAIDSYMESEGNDILVLASMDAAERDNWAKYIYSVADEHCIPEVQSMCHSTRISRRLQQRGVEAASLYSSIYGGSNEMKTSDEEDLEDETGLQIVPIRSDEGMDDKALVIIHEAHLISRSLAQSDLLRFGSGRLLEDLLKYMNPEKNRKLVFLGDPYMLTYGSFDDSAMNIAGLKELSGERIIHYFKQDVQQDSADAKDSLRASLARSMDCEIFNNISYDYSDPSMVEVGHDDIINKIREWFSYPFGMEPDRAVLFYKKADCVKTNLWIKKYCLNNGQSIAKGDLLIANNNIFIPDDTGFGNPKRVLNGMYFTVLDIKGHESFTTTLKGSNTPVTLSFTLISAICLSLNRQSADIWVLDNYILSEDELSKEEQISMRIFISSKVAEAQKKAPFKDSLFYQKLVQDPDYVSLNEIEKSNVDVLINNRLLPKDKRQKITTTSKEKSLVRKYYTAYVRSVQQNVRENDPLVNALYVKYGWTITVHKALGSAFNEIILKGYRGENIGSNNEPYFRWLYSGITTTTTICHITQPEIITPFINCIVSDTATQGVSKIKKILLFSGDDVLERHKEMVASCNTNTAGAISKVSYLIEPLGYILEKVDRSSDYLTKALYSIPADTNKRLILDFNNKGAKDSWGVSSIRIEPNDSIDNNIINEKINCLWEEGGADPHDTGAPDYIETIIESLKTHLEGKGIIISHLSSKEYQEIYTAKTSEGESKVRIWYGTSAQNHSKGFINKIEVFDSTDSSIYEEVKSYVLGRR